MTSRTDNIPKTPCECAVEETIRSLRDLITVNYIQFQVSHQMTEAQFRRVVAGYLERQSIEEICETVGLKPEDLRQ